ncbi:unnamed protein product [Amoebophrya sp. A120]|nr:unnamed protein product [Amoebophrya sp. A120]|eukprot:GSA120T00021419001.1
MDDGKEKDLTLDKLKAKKTKDDKHKLAKDKYNEDDLSHFKDQKDKDYKDKKFKDKDKDYKYKADKLSQGHEGAGTTKNKTKRAGLIFPVAKIQKELRNMLPANARLNSSSSVFLGGVMEYVVAELLEVAGNTVKNQGKKRINPRHLQVAIKNDDELNTLIRATIAGGGVVPDKTAVQMMHERDEKAKQAAKKRHEGGGGAGGQKFEMFSEDMIYEPPQKKQKAAYDNVSKTSVFDANLNMKNYDVAMFEPHFNFGAQGTMPDKLAMGGGEGKKVVGGKKAAVFEAQAMAEKKKKKAVAAKMPLFAADGSFFQAA